MPPVGGENAQVILLRPDLTNQFSCDCALAVAMGMPEQQEPQDEA